jgi:hypothetical protein
MHPTEEVKLLTQIAKQQEAEIERLRAALVRISVMNTDTFEAMGPLLSCIEIARAALKETSGE